MVRNPVWVWNDTLGEDGEEKWSDVVMLYNFGLPRLRGNQRWGTPSGTLNVACSFVGVPVSAGTAETGM